MRRGENAGARVGQFMSGFKCRPRSRGLRYRRCGGNAGLDADRCTRSTVTPLPIPTPRDGPLDVASFPWCAWSNIDRFSNGFQFLGTG